MSTPNFSKNIADIHALDKQRRQELSDMIERVLANQKELELLFIAQDTERLQDQVNNETFKILIIGEFNTGKSTFINALLGKEILPSKAIPATAIINVIKYGETPAARLHFKDPDKEAFDIPIEKLQDYVLIKNTDKAAAEAEIKDSPYTHAEIWWPLDLCRDNNMEIIDSPGLNEDVVRENLTLDYIQKVDAVLFVLLSVGFGPAKTEMDTMRRLEEAGHRDLFFIINQWDLLRPKQRIEVKGKALQDLPEMTNRKKDIYFASALDALEGRIDKNPEMEAQSGIPELEASLHHFLAYDKGETKNQRNAQIFRQIIRKMEEEEIPQKVHLWQMPQNVLKEKYEAAKKDLAQLEEDKTNMLRFMQRKREEITDITELKIKDFLFTIDRDIDRWTEEYEMEIDLPYTPANVKNAINDLIQHLSDRLKEEFNEWEEDTLSPGIQEQVKVLYEELEYRATDFEKHLRDAQFSLNGEHFKPGDVEDNFGPQSPLERILAAAGGWVVGGIGAGAIGALFGWKEMLKALLPNVAAIIAAVAIGIPVIPVAIIVGLITGWSAVEGLKNKVKEEVCKKFKTTLGEKSSGQAKQIAKQLNKKLKELENALIEGMERQIAEVRERAESALADHNAGESEVQKKLLHVEAVKLQLQEVREALEAFINNLRQSVE